MYVRDIMTKNVITVPGNTSVVKARKIMEEGNFKRLPVVDNGKLIGIVTKDRLEKAIPEGNYCSIWEFANGLATLTRTPVSRVMHTRVVTISPDATAEEAVLKAQTQRVGALVAVEDNKIVGIVTTNDFFYRIVNNVLGVGEPGTRIEVTGGGESEPLEEIISTINKRGLNIVTLHIVKAPERDKKDVVVHIDGGDANELVEELRNKGYKVDFRKRIPDS